MEKKIYYYASCENILAMGPYENEAEAWECLRLSEMESIKQRRIHAKDGRVWASYSPNEVSGQYDDTTDIQEEFSLETTRQNNQEEFSFREAIRQASLSLWDQTNRR